MKTESWIAHGSQPWEVVLQLGHGHAYTLLAGWIVVDSDTVEATVGGEQQRLIRGKLTRIHGVQQAEAANAERAQEMPAVGCEAAASECVIQLRRHFTRPSDMCR